MRMMWECVIGPWRALQGSFAHDDAVAAACLLESGLRGSVEERVKLVVVAALYWAFQYLLCYEKLTFLIINSFTLYVAYILGASAEHNAASGEPQLAAVR